MGDLPVAELSEAAHYPQPHPRRRAGLAIGAAVVVAAIVAATVAITRSSHSSAPHTVTVAEVTAGTRGTVRFHLTQTAPNGSRQADMLGADGVADFTNRSGTINYTIPARLLSGSNAPRRETELYAGNHMYLGADAYTSSFFDLSGGRLTGGSPLPPKVKWIEIPFAVGGTGSSPFGGTADPRNIVAALTAKGVAVTELGNATIDGVATTHYRFRRTHRVVKPHAFTVRDVIDLWTDHEHRLVKIVNVSASQGDVTTMTETFSDYGGPAPVHAPPADEVYRLPTNNRSTGTSIPAPPPPPPLPSPPKQLDGSWSLVAKGSSPIMWKVWYGTASGGWTCFASEPAAVTDPNLETNGAMVSGKRAWCATDATTFGPTSGVELFAQQFVAPSVFMGLTRDGAHSLVLHLSDGSTVPLTVDGHGAFGWYGRGTVTSLTYVDAHGMRSCAGATMAGAPKGVPAPQLWSCLAGAA